MAQGVLIFRPGGSGHADGGHADGVPVASRGRASGMASELRRAFRKRALESHPDKHPPDRRTWATQEMQRVNWAYKFLL